MSVEMATKRAPVKGENKVNRELRSLIFAMFDSQSEAACKLGISKSRLTRILRGQYEPRVKEIERFAEVLGDNAYKALIPALAGKIVFVEQATRDVQKPG